MNQTTTLEFNGTALSVIEHDGQRWLTAEQVGRCLGYAEANARIGISNLYTRHSDEFTTQDTCVIKLITQGQGRDLRLFSPTGCNLLGFFSNTPRAKEFRVWAKNVLAMQPTLTEPVAPAAIAGDLNIKIDRLLDLMEQILKVIPALLDSARPASRRTERKKMYEEDTLRIIDLAAKGYLLVDLMAETGFSQSQCYAVTTGRYKVLESGRVSIDPRSDIARDADAAAKAQREGL